MSDHALNLGRAARLLKRIDDLPNGPETFEGVSVKDIIGDVLLAQNEAFMREAYDRVGLSSGETQPTNVIPFPDRHSVRVGA